MPDEDSGFATRMRAGALDAGLEERQALARIESRLFGQQPKPITLSRYVLLELCGRGSRGAVYRAYDPQLDRKVAIKLLLSRRGGRAQEAALLREARAMARVSHLNVIAVHDVGSYDEHDLGLDRSVELERFEIPSRGVFVVMELIEGQDLREWLAHAARDWRAITTAFVAAGQGLAAAHDAGLVHRDFKPSNVRVGSDGRICVLDFGLARAVEDHVDDRTAVVGTPMYMSPEQHRGEPADARSDQYSFGVALYEALARNPPFAGNLADIATRKLGDEWIWIDEQLELPSGVWEVVRRCVRPEPDDRFASMHEVLAALAVCLAARRRRWLLLAGAPILAVAVAGFALVREPPTRASTEGLCSGGDDRIAKVWNEDVRAGIERRLQTSGMRYADATWAEVRRELDDYTQAWARQHRQACEATRLRGEQSEAILDLRMACLDRRLHEVEVVTATLANADAGVVENAVVAVNALGWLGACSDLGALRSRFRLPQASENREAIELGYARLTEAMIIDAAGRYEAAGAIADAVAVTARRLDYLPLRAAAALRRASAFEGRGEFEAAEHALIDALAAAEASRDEPVAADAWLRMVWIVGVELRRGDEGEVWLRLAEAALERLGDDPVREATLIHNRAGLRLRQGRDTLALADYLAALEAQTELLGTSDPAVARTLNHIANVLINLHRFDEAWAYAERSLVLRVETLGADHPLVAACYNNMAQIRMHQGDPLGAAAMVERALGVGAIEGTAFEVVARVVAKDAYRSLDVVEPTREQIERLLELPAERYPRSMTRATLQAELAELAELDLRRREGSIEGLR